MFNRDAVLRKFRNPFDQASTRRRDFKGDRRRVNLRLPEDICDHLDVIRIASGLAKNAFCENALREATMNRIKELKAQHDPKAWETILACAKVARR
jgi:hypothetical protein